MKNSFDLYASILQNKWKRELMNGCNRSGRINSTFRKSETINEWSSAAAPKLVYETRAHNNLFCNFIH